MLVPVHIAQLRAVAKAMKSFSLKPAKQIQFKFDPFNDDVQSIRDFLFYISAGKYRLTNPKCSFKTNVCNDRSEPIVKISLVNKQEIVFKTSNLNSVELLQLFNKYVSDLDKKEEEGAEKKAASVATAQSGEKSKKKK